MNFSGKLYRATFYGVEESTGRVNYDTLEATAQTEKPKLIICGASAYSQIIDFGAFSRIARSVNAYLLADIAHIAGLVAAGSGVVAAGCGAMGAAAGSAVKGSASAGCAGVGSVVGAGVDGAKVESGWTGSRSLISGTGGLFVTPVSEPNGVITSSFSAPEALKSSVEPAGVDRRGVAGASNVASGSGSPTGALGVVFAGFFGAPVALVGSAS